MESLNSRQRAAMETRERILSAALELFSRKGFNGAAVKEISILLNISEGLIYHYFPTKNILLLAVFERLSLERLDIGYLTDNCKGKSIEEKLKLLSAEIYEMLEQRKELISVIYSEALVNKTLAKMVTNMIGKYVESLSGMISEIITGCVDEQRLSLLAQAYFGAIFQFFLLNENLTLQKNKTYKDEFFTTTSQVFTYGLTNMT